MTKRSDEFFHGTTHRIHGDMIKPANAAGRNTSEYSYGDPGNLSEGNHAFVARNDEHYAWYAARTFHPNGRRPAVYQVEPAKDMVPGPWNEAHPNYREHMEEAGYDPDDEEIRGQDEWASPSGFKIRSRIDIMPGRQGTFPGENWNKYKREGPLRGPDANHPSDADIATTYQQIQEHKQQREDSAFLTRMDRVHDTAAKKGLALPIEPVKRRLATLFD